MSNAHVQEYEWFNAYSFQSMPIAMRLAHKILTVVPEGMSQTVALILWTAIH